MTCEALTAQPRSMGGYTLVEVLVVIVILAVISAGLSTVFITGQKEYGVREATIRMQQQARQAMNEMERELKNTGYGLMDMGDLTVKVYKSSGAIPSWQVVEASDGGTEPDSIKVLYSGAESDVGYDYIVSVDHPTSSALMLVSAVGSVPPSRTLNDDFIKGDLFLVYDPSDPGKPATRFQATNVTAPDKIHHNPGGYNPSGGTLDVAYGVGSKVLNLRLMQAKSVSYSVDARQNLIKTVEDLSLIDPPANQRTKIVASGVEDLQIRYQFKDGTWKNAGDPGFVAKDLRAIQVSIIVRTEKPDPRYPWQSLQLTGSYGNGGVKNSAGYRRMAMSTIIYVRNLGFRD